jgi:hypothetical protein
MTKEQFDREKFYQVTLAVARVMLQSGLIIEDELTSIDVKMRENYRPLLGSLWP